MSKIQNTQSITAIYICRRYIYIFNFSFSFSSIHMLCRYFECHLGIGICLLKGVGCTQVVQKNSLIFSNSILFSSVEKRTRRLANLKVAAADVGKESRLKHRWYWHIFREYVISFMLASDYMMISSLMLRFEKIKIKSSL